MPEEKTLPRLLEAALFMSPGVITIRDLAKIAETNVAEVRVALNGLIQEYDEKETALCIVEEEKGFRMKVKDIYDDDVGHLASSPEFHKGVMKTLAFIAFKQPIEQAKVIKFRNTKAYDHVRVLKEKGFIRKERLGSTYKIYTTKKFHDYFGQSLKGKEFDLEKIKAMPEDEKELQAEEPQEETI